MPSSQPTLSLPSIHEMLPDSAFHGQAQQPSPHSRRQPWSLPTSSAPIPVLDSRQPRSGRTVVPIDTDRSTRHGSSSGPSSMPSYSMSPLHSSSYGAHGALGQHSSTSSQSSHSHASTRNPYPMHVPSHRVVSSQGGNVRTGSTRTSSEDRWTHAPSSSVDSSASPLSPSGSESDELAEDEGALGPGSYGYSPSGMRSTDAEDVHRRHECPHCHRRFNRPSSLGIHINTHTGERPFVCPYAGCGKAFNVNSNMRRHYRKHVVVADSASHPAAEYPIHHHHPHDSVPLDLQFIRYQDSVPVGFSPAKFS